MTGRAGEGGRGKHLKQKILSQAFITIYITRLLMKLFRTGSPVVFEECQRYFNFLPIKQQLTIRTAKFLQSFMASENTLCSLFAYNASN